MKSKQITLEEYAMMYDLLEDLVMYYKARHKAMMLLKEFCKNKFNATTISLAAVAKLYPDKLTREEYELVKGMREVVTCHEVMHYEPTT